MHALKIGIVSETLVQQRYLKQVVEDSGCQPAYDVLVSDLLKGQEQLPVQSIAIDAWVIVVDIERLDQSDHETAFQQWMYELEQPVIFSEGNTNNAAEADFLSWSRQLKNKLLSLEGQIKLAKKNVEKAKYVWVLAASTGGPDAVKRFLDVMDSGLDLGFIYAQHIDNQQCRILSETIVRDSHYKSFVADHGDIIAKNTVAVIPTTHTVELQSNGSIVCRQEREWRGVYQPSIDQIVANVASVYGECSGVIFFTGMGDDGAAGCRFMSLHGGPVWAQTTTSCVASAMPEAVINTGYVDKIDTPENLANHLNEVIKERTLSVEKV
jgi:chemosensory pili system protein ChpB (putative protein-glutamate methylesterase)